MLYDPSQKLAGFDSFFVMTIKANANPYIENEIEKDELKMKQEVVCEDINNGWRAMTNDMEIKN